MVLSKRCEYALRALIDIGLARALGRERVPLGELARHEGISEPFLAHILLQLNDAGVLSSRRGRHGGYAFAVAPSEVKPGDIVRLIDGPLAPVRCVSTSAYERCSCPDELHCGLRILMSDVRDAISDVLDRHTLGDVVDVTLRFMRRDGVAFPLATPTETSRGD